MGPRKTKMSRLEIAASLTPVVMALAIVTFPVTSDSDTDFEAMPFDSIGAMLQDMDRERAVEDMERYASLPMLEARDSSYACETEDLNQRLQQVYNGLQERIAQIDLKAIARLERRIELQEKRNEQLAELSSAVTSRQARREAKQAAAQLRKAITELKRETERDNTRSDQDVNVAIESALRAAEAALANAP